ncbi:DUF2867 domain-containing protein [Tenacibaculum xiamenense]|uniref:DUF2867 domain-containing protein n=1 Tax=Tenacibaculum xiamenense TaxID=1261553 RepID=UPI0038954806
MGTTNSFRKVVEEPVSLKKKHQELLKLIDFSDTFSTTNHSNSIKEITQLIFNYSPKWIDTLFSIRNKLAAIVGLKNSVPEDYNNDFKIGGYVGFFKIYDLEGAECILGLNDSHLNFRVIIARQTLEQYNVKVTTLVEYNNLKGKIYMTIIKPFHRIVVKRMVANAFSS